jgi:CspA family cold shock protein
MATGTVKWFNPTKGYGFIVPDEGDNDVFVHITAVEQAGMGTLNEGQRISFEVRNEPRGLKAVDLAAADGGDKPAAEEAPAATEGEGDGGD